MVDVVLCIVFPVKLFAFILGDCINLGHLLSTHGIR